MRCRCCDSPNASWIYYYEEYYCPDCLDAVEEAISDSLDFEDYREMYLED